MAGPAASAGTLRLLMSEAARAALAPRIEVVLGEAGLVPVFAAHGEDADLAFVSREVTGASTKHEILPATQRFYDALLAAPSLRWVQAHSSGADRAIYVELRRRGVTVTTSSGTNGTVVAQSALAGLLALARELPQLMAAQRAHRWAPLLGTRQPLDLEGQLATIVGWGPIGQRLGMLLGALGLQLAVVRGSEAPATLAGAEIVASLPFERLAEVLPRTDWLVLACPLSPRTQGLVDAAALARLPAGARIVNVARGEIVDEPALIEALRGAAGQAPHLGGAYLDVFAHEPLVPGSPLWDLPNVIVSPHTAGHAAGNEARVATFFLDNLRRWTRREPLLNVSG